MDRLFEALITIFVFVVAIGTSAIAIAIYVAELNLPRTY